MEGGVLFLVLVLQEVSFGASTLAGLVARGVESGGGLLLAVVVVRCFSSSGWHRFSGAVAREGGRWRLVRLVVDMGSDRCLCGSVASANDPEPKKLGSASPAGDLFESRSSFSELVATAVLKRVRARGSLLQGCWFSARCSPSGDGSWAREVRW